MRTAMLCAHLLLFWEHLLTSIKKWFSLTLLQLLALALPSVPEHRTMDLLLALLLATSLVLLPY